MDRPPELSIIVPARGLWPLTRECLSRVRRHTPGRVEVLVVDGGCLASARRAMAAFARRWPALRVLPAPEPRSFSSAMNAGLRAARGKVLVWLNNDAFVTPGWSRSLLEALEIPGVGAAGPCTDDPGCVGGRFARRLPSAELDRAAAAWALRYAGCVEPARLLNGFCLAVRREAMESVGLLDERLRWGEEDDDYSFRLRQAGWRLALCLPALVGHVGGATRGRWPSARRRALARGNAAVLHEKWRAEAARIRRDLRGLC